MGTILIALSACSETTTRTSSDKSSHLKSAQTYRWLSPDDAKALNLQNPKTMQPVYNYTTIVQRPEIEEKVRRVVEKDLQDQGYRPDLTGQPDFFVTYYSQAKNKDWISSWSGTTLSFQGAPLVAFPNFDMNKAKEFRPGMAYIVFYDPVTQRPAWSGTIVDALQQGQVNPQIDSRVQELIADFKTDSGELNA